MFPTQVLMGVGSNGAWLAGTSLTPQYFPKVKAKMNGIATTGTSVGCVVCSQLWKALILSHGWRFTFRFVAVSF